MWAKLQGAAGQAATAAAAAPPPAGVQTQTVTLPNGTVRTVTRERVPLRPPTDAEAEEFLRTMPRRIRA